jgi:N-acetylglucosaminyldiphosphoundecaprenol N-acetyl-beta-D-mannosaminyltransferase
MAEVFRQHSELSEGVAVDPPRVQILGVGVSAITLQKAVALIDEWIAWRDRKYICTCTTGSILEATRDPAYWTVLENAALATPDGMPLVWLARRRTHLPVTRVYGPDLLLAVCALSEMRQYRHYFLGGKPGVPERLAERLVARFPRLVVAGTESPPFRDLTPEEAEALVDRVNRSTPDILWVGLGAPKQDFWMASFRERITAPVMIGVGAAFDFHAGAKPQAPRWMQASGLEWLFRLMTEPRRLWRRSLYNGPKFVYFLALEALGLREFHRTSHRGESGTT